MKVIFYANEIYGQCFISVAVRFIPVCVLFFYLSNRALQEPFPLATFFFHISVLFNYVQLINLLHVFT